MSQFYASIEGNRGMATRCGTKSSGMYGHIRAWGVGCEAECFEEDGVDKVRIYLTAGSTRRKSAVYIGTFTAEDL